MTSKVDLLKRERDDQRKLADHWKLQHDDYKKLNAKLASRAEDLEAETSRLTAEVRVRQTIVEEARDERDAALADVEKLRAALNSIAANTYGYEPDVLSDEEAKNYFAGLFFDAQNKARAALSGGEHE
jgi:uncharacterized coiled-coil DUF342 family protein